MSTKDKLVTSLLAQQNLAPVLKALNLEPGCGDVLLSIMPSGWQSITHSLYITGNLFLRIPNKRHICVHPDMGTAVDSVAAFFTFMQRRFSMFEARQRGQKPNLTCPILNDLHFTNIHRYVAMLIYSWPCILLENYHLELVLQQSRCLTIDKHHYCREVDTGTRYLRRRLVGRNDQEKLLGIIVFRTINRCVITAFLFPCLG